VLTAAWAVLRDGSLLAALRASLARDFAGFTIGVMVFIYFIGHLQGTAREYWLHEHGADWAIRLFLAFVALVFPDLQAFNLVDQVVTGAAIQMALFLKIAGMAVLYITVYTALAVVAFSGKEL